MPYAAIVEWTIAFGFTFYLLTFFWDLRMSKGVRRGELSRERLLAMQQRGQGLAAMREANEAGAGSRPSGLGGAHGTAAPNGYPQMGYATNGRAAQ